MSTASADQGCDQRPGTTPMPRSDSRSPVEKASQSDAATGA